VERCDFRLLIRSHVAGRSQTKVRRPACKRELVDDVLDQWVKGDLKEKSFLKAVNWRKVWGFDPGLYMRLFNSARMHRIPMVALKVDRQLVSCVGAEGWDAVLEKDREGLSDSATESAAYQRELARVYVEKNQLTGHGKDHGGPATTQRPAVSEEKDLTRS